MRSVREKIRINGWISLLDDCCFTGRVRERSGVVNRLDSLPVDFPESERYSEDAMRSLNLHHGHHHHHHAQSVLAAVSGVAK